MATFFAGLTVQLFKYIIASMVDLERFVGVFSQLIIPAVAGGLVFIIAVHFLKMEEYIYIKKSLNKKLFRKKQLILEEDAGEISGI